MIVPPETDRPPIHACSSATGATGSSISNIRRGRPRRVAAESSMALLGAMSRRCLRRMFSRLDLPR